MTIHGKPCIVYTEKEHEELINMLDKQKELIEDLRSDMNAQRTK